MIRFVHFTGTYEMLSYEVVLCCLELLVSVVHVVSVEQLLLWPDQSCTWIEPVSTLMDLMLEYTQF